MARAVLAQHAQIAELERELERWRTGKQFAELEDDILRLKAALTEALDGWSAWVASFNRGYSTAPDRIAELRKLVTP